MTRKKSLVRIQYLPPTFAARRRLRAIARRAEAGISCTMEGNVSSKCVRNKFLRPLGYGWQANHQLLSPNELWLTAARRRLRSKGAVSASKQNLQFSKSRDYLKNFRWFFLTVFRIGTWHIHPFGFEGGCELL